MAEGRLGGAELAGIEHTAEALARLPRVVVPGRAAGRDRQELACGRALAAVLSCSAEVAAAVAFELGRSLQGEPLVVGLDLEAGLARLPWELLARGAAGPHLESSGGRVVRLLPGPSGGPREGDGTVAVWHVDDSGVTEPIVEAVAVRCRELGLGLVSLPRDLASLPDLPGAVLHVVCHGRSQVDGVSVLLGAERSAGAPAAHLHALLQQVRVVVLDICEAADGAADTPAAAFVEAGAPACVAPRTRTSVTASCSFAAGFYDTLAEGGSVVRAVGEGRRRVDLLGHPHPDSRWSNASVHAADLQALAEVEHRGWRPAGWPRPSAAAARWLDAAHALGRLRGFVGVEQLALTVSAADQAEGPVRVLAFAVDGHGAALKALGEGLDPQGGTAHTVGTPRLADLSPRLQPGFGCGALAEWLLSDDQGVLRRLLGVGLPRAGSETFATFATCAEEQDRRPVRALVVLGGPEDGRELPIGVVGRHNGSPGPTALYFGSGVLDRRLSRRHLEITAHGFQLLRPARLVSGGERALAPGPLELAVGDVLLLGSATRLLAVP